MEPRMYDCSITFRLTRAARNDIFEWSKLEGVTVTHLIRSIITGYLEWKKKQTIMLP
jgi:hypothetical protein